MDVRTRFTRMAIEEAFVGLLAEKPVDRVTVTELCERAEINRGTFYRHFRDPRDLLASMEERIVEEVSASATQVPRDLAGHLTAILENLRLTHRRYEALFSENGDPAFLSRFVARCYERVDGGALPATVDLSAPEPEWLFSFLMQGCSGVIGTWMESGMNEPPEEVAAFITRLLESALRAVASPPAK